MKRPAAPPADWSEPAEGPAGAPVADPETGISPPAASPEPPRDSFEARFKEAQAWGTKKAQEAADLRRRLEAYESDEDGDEAGTGDGDGEPAPLSRFRPRIPESERATAAHDSEAVELGRSVAEAVHGADVVADFDRAMGLFSEAATESDRITAFEAYHDLRSRSASQAPRRSSPAEGLPSRDQAVTPRVETNRPDGPMDVDLTDPGRYAAGANGGVGGWVRELLGARRNSR